MKAGAAVGERHLEEFERVCKALADRTRLRILALLASGEVCVCHIHESLRISQPKASRHLAYLKRERLVDDRRQGLWVYYRLATPEDPVARTFLASAIHALSHFTVAARDAARLERALGRRGGVEQKLPVFACCEAGNR